MIARELTEFFAGFSPERRAGRAAARRPGLPLERERLLPRAPAGRRSASPTSTTPRTRRSARAMLAAGWRKVYHPARGGAPRARLRPGRVHAALLRRVPRAARDDRPRRAAVGARRAPACAAPGARPTARWMRERGWPRRRARARWTRALGRAPRRPRACSRRSARAPSGCPARRAAARSRSSAARRRRGAPRRRPVAPPERAGAALRRGARLRADGPAAARRPVPGHGRARERCTSPS